MAMTKEQQKEASARIMDNMGQLTPEEQQTYELLTRRPEDYLPPDPNTEERVCGICGEVFETVTKDKQAIPALEQHADHMAVHNPSPGQWAEAHKRIQSWRESARKEL